MFNKSLVLILIIPLVFIFSNQKKMVFKLLQMQQNYLKEEIRMMVLKESL